MIQNKKITISILALILIILGTVSMVLYFNNFNSKVPKHEITSLPRTQML